MTQNASKDLASVATLIAGPQTAVISKDLLADVAGELPASGTPVWLDPERAVDIPFVAETRGRRAVTDRLLGIVGGAAIDVVVQPADHRRKRLFLADMDSTMIGQECIDELADQVGLKSHVAAITERSMRGDIAFEPALRERVALLKGLPASAIDEVIAQRIRLTAGARTLIATMRAHGAYTCLVSGGFTSFTQRVAQMIGFDEQRANVLSIAPDGTLAGLVEEPILGAAAKLETLMQLTERLKLSLRDTLAVGDGANDLAMIGAAGLGIAYHAKPKVAAAAHARIAHGDLTALLFAQGYKSAEFAA